MTAAADVRVYVFTYRRNHLLPRALRSLIAQTHANWICEVHNDDPQDQDAARIVSDLRDRRIVYVRHARNLGATATFNLAFRAVAEPFISILEDDNWWEPTLLARLLEAMRTHPRASVAFANMWLWQEVTGFEWRKQGTIWPDRDGGVETFSETHPRQVCGSLHSNGAMLVRSAIAAALAVPDDLPFFVMESCRDRLIPLPMVLVREPLGNFAITLESSRTESADENLQILTLLAASQLERHNSPAFLRRVWQENRGHRGHTWRAIVAAAMLRGCLSTILRVASPTDLLLVGGWVLRHPGRFLRMLSAARRFPEIAGFLRRANAPNEVRS